MRIASVVVTAALALAALPARAEPPRAAPLARVAAPALPKPAPKPLLAPPKAPAALLAASAPSTPTTVRVHLDAHASAKPAAPARAKPAAPAPFPESRVTTLDGTSLRAFLAGSHEPPASHDAPPADVRQLAAGVHLLMEGGPDKYDRVFVTPTYVALVRKTGIVDLVARPDAEAQIRTGESISGRRVDVGIGPKGRTMFGEAGPGDTVRLYRQLPRKAQGDLVTPDGFTSFALTGDDAYHPFGEAGTTVTLAIPRAMFERARSGEIGGTGWQGGGGAGIDVIEEMQIDSRVLKQHLEPLAK